MQLIHVPQGRYALSKRFDNELEMGETVAGKIIQEELKPLVKGRYLKSFTLESSLGLHTIRLGLGNPNPEAEPIDFVIHMRKESLLGINVEPFSNEYLPRKGINIKFCKDIIAHQPDYAYFSSKFESMEKRFTQDSEGPVGKMLFEINHDISSIFPTFYTEDWVNIKLKSSPKRHLVFSMQPNSLIGIGTGCKQGIDCSDTIYTFHNFSERILGNYGDGLRTYSIYQPKKGSGIREIKE